MGWWLLVVYVLHDHTLRSNELSQAIDGVSRRTLTAVLRRLQRDGIVKRIVVPTIPHSSQYRSTRRG
jgi:DNA-binding HxlR family transcriptional regulator